MIFVFILRIFFSLRWRLRIVVCCLGTLFFRIKLGFCWEGGEEDGCWGGALLLRVVVKVSVLLTFFGICLYNFKYSR